MKFRNIIHLMRLCLHTRRLLQSPDTQVVNYFNFLKLRFGLIIGQERKTKTFDARSVRDLVANIKNVD